MLLVADVPARLVLLVADGAAFPLLMIMTSASLSGQANST